MKVADLREREEDLGFRPEDAVRWLSPRELWRAGVKVVLSSVFASYADKREVQEALQPTTLEVLPAGGELWLDFVADLGDGFDATCTVAGLLAADRLDPELPSGGKPVGPLPRASVLVLGGDEVYPTASAQEYDNRMKGPYLGLPCRTRRTRRRCSCCRGTTTGTTGSRRSSGCSPRGGRSEAGAPARTAATSPCNCRTGGGWSAWTPSSAAS